MIRYAFVDPGLKGAGLALFEDGRLVSCERVVGENWINTALEVAVRASDASYLTIEGMSVRAQAQYAWADVIKLSLMSGCLAGYWLQDREEEAVSIILAATWTRGRKKPIRRRQYNKILRKHELSILCAAEAQWGSVKDKTEIQDAVGLGLFYFKRNEA